MGRNSIDDMIEGWARGLGSGVRTAVDKSDQGGLKGWTAPEAPPPALEGNVTYLDAAKALRDAVVAKKGRKPTVETWRPVAGKALGLKRLVQAKWQAVLDAGVEAGLFFIDNDSYSYPVLSIPEAPKVQEPEPVDEAVEVEEAPKRKPTRREDLNVPSKLPEGWVSPVTFKCGHQNFPHNGVEPDDPKQVAAREAGFCCERLAEANRRHQKLNPGKPGKPGQSFVSINWRVRGLYEPVPEGKRRSLEREGGLGFPGLCCDPKTGLYIGGLGNNCRHYHKGKERCPVHAPKERA